LVLVPAIDIPQSTDIARQRLEGFESQPPVRLGEGERDKDVREKDQSPKKEIPYSVEGGLQEASPAPRGVSLYPLGIACAIEEVLTQEGS